MRILITGGAGFIGSHVGDELLRHGHEVRVLDVLAPQVHGESAGRPDYLNDDIELIRGDVRDPDAVRRALDSVDAVYHFAAAVGVGQSMYEVQRYTSVNNIGTAVLLEALVERPVERLVVASSMSLYGEGAYQTAQGEIVPGPARSREQLAQGRWELTGADGGPLMPVPTPEDKRPELASVYALSKWDQEQLCLMVGAAYDIPTVALRFFNVFGTRQALSNPYTGVLAIFAARLLNAHRPMVFEDGLQRRDFVSVTDVAQACRLALEVDAAAGHAVNVGSGRAYTICDVAEMLATVLGLRIEPEISRKYRVGDIRHCFADISRARELLGYEPRVPLEDGIVELAEWLEGQAARDMVDEASAELAARGLTV
jgi:dTDP-L-rhamnose 4-epimerase